MKLQIFIFLILMSVTSAACTTSVEPVEQQDVIETVSEEVFVEPSQDESLSANITKNEAIKEPELVQDEENDVQEIAHDPGLIAHLTFDDSGDDIVSGFDGEIKGGAEFKSGKIGNGLYFDGVDDYVELSTEALATLGELKQGTIAFWLNFDSILDNQPVMPIFYMGIDDQQNKVDNMYIIEIGHAAGTEAPFDNQYPEGTPDPKNKRIYSTWIKDGQEPFLCSDSEVNLVEGVWQHFTVVAGPDGNTLYLNGEEVRNRDYNFGHSTDKAFLDDIPVKEIMTIGYGRSHTWISPEFVYFKGLLDDFRIYDRPLESEEILELFSAD